MTTYRFRVYYQWKGPSKSDIFGEEKSLDDIAWAFDRLPTEFEHRLPDQNATAEVTGVDGNPNEVILIVSTFATEQEVMNALVPTLQDWRLFGEKLD